jgi:RNA polymerase sigma factor for flagellar operon FliA
MDTLSAESRMVEEHLPFLHEMVSCMVKDFPLHIRFEDLYGYGLLGLLQGVRGYDPSFETKFTSYAQIRIRGAIYTELSRDSWSTKTTRDRVCKYGEVAAKLEQKLQRSPTEDEILEQLGLTDVERKNFLRDVQSTKIVSLDAALAKDDTEFNVRGVIDENAGDPAAIAAQNDFMELVLQHVRTLPKTEQEIIRLYFFEDLDQTEIGELFGVHRSRIGQILHPALQLLRRRLLKLET